MIWHPPFVRMLVELAEFMSDQCEFALAQLVQAQRPRGTGGEHG